MADVMKTRVVKFGGTSLADAQQMRKAAGIVRSDPSRRFVVASAPAGVTNLLYKLYDERENGLGTLDRIRDIYRALVEGLGLKFNIFPHLGNIWNAANSIGSKDYIASRGEFINAQIFAELLGYEFADAADVILFHIDGKLDECATARNCRQLAKSGKNYVIPGFYGSLPHGKVKTFSRGGSDLTAAIVAAGTGAAVMEKWTDVPGMLMADPGIVGGPQQVDVVTFSELRELSYGGAKVLHDEVVFPLRAARIPIMIRNTNEPEAQGTIIVPDDEAPRRPAGTIAGIAGRKNFRVVEITKALMNQELGFLRRVCRVFEEHKVNIEHIPGGIDAISVIVADTALNGKLGDIKAALQRRCKPDSIAADRSMSLICTVGRGMVHTPGVAARLFQAVADAGVSVQMMDQGPSELSIIIGVANDDFEKAIRAIYRALVP